MLTIEERKNDIIIIVMNRLLKRITAIMLTMAVVCMIGCKKTDEPNNGGNNGNNGNNGGNGGETPEAPAIVSTSEVQYDGKVFVEAVFEDETKMYFVILSPTEVAVVSGEFYYQDNPSQAFKYRGEVIIPEKIIHLNSTYYVTAIAYKAFYGCNLLSSVFIPNSVISIDSYIPYFTGNIFGAFQECTNLLNIKMSKNVQYIGENAFKGCPCYTDTVTIPSRVKRIEKAAFDAKSVFFNADSCYIAGGLDYPNSPMEPVIISAFPNLDCISFGDNVKVLPSYLYSNMNPSIVDIPSSVNAISHEAFRGCTNLERINNTQNIKTIGVQAFYYCWSLNSITFGDELTRIEYGAFQGCGSLITIAFPNSLAKIGSGAFAGCGLRSIVWGISIDTISESAFRSCHHLKEVNIPNTVTTIENGAFELCDSLSSLSIGCAVTSIGYSAFRGCHELVSVSFGNSVTTIKARAFRDCRKLVNIVLPNTIQFINDNAFDECYEASSVTCYAENPPVLGIDVFKGRRIEAIYVPALSVEAYKTTEGWSKYADVIVGI